MCFADGGNFQQECSMKSLLNVIAEQVNSYVASLHEFIISVGIALQWALEFTNTHEQLLHFLNNVASGILPHVASRKADMISLLTLGHHCMASQTIYASQCLLVCSLHKRSIYKEDKN